MDVNLSVGLTERSVSGKMVPAAGQRFPRPAGDELADAGERELREISLPSGEQPGDADGFDGEEHFEILAVAQGLRSRAARSERDCGMIDHKSTTGSGREAREVLR